MSTGNGIIASDRSLLGTFDPKNQGNKQHEHHHERNIAEHISSKLQIYLSNLNIFKPTKP